MNTSTLRRGFWRSFNFLDSVEERIELILSTDFDLTRESQPESITDQFGFDITWEEALRVARAMIQRIGPIMIAGTATICREEMQTIIDTADDDELFNCNPVVVAALRHIGIREARNYAPRDLLMTYDHIFPGALLDEYYSELKRLFDNHKKCLEDVFLSIKTTGP